MNSKAQFKYEQLKKKLKQLGFSGDISNQKSSLIVASTDNSIYQVTPNLLLFPKIENDIILAAGLASELNIPITARGGGTGTNGQSLNQGIILDYSRYMTKILDIDLVEKSATVEPGVVLDQLNTALAKFGYFFAPTVSTSSRATIGGMFATDASGKGSRIYGRTSDHVLEAKMVLADGSTAHVSENHTDGKLTQINQWLSGSLTENIAEIKEKFPQMNRGLTGYNLDEAYTKSKQVNFIKLLAGSEGTLALTSKLKLNILPIPKHKSLTVLAYDDCGNALAHVDYLSSANATAIEFLDDKILELAAASPMWSELEGMLGNFKNAKGFLFVEFTGQSLKDIENGQAILADLLKKNSHGCLAQKTTFKQEEMSALWEMRKRSVGLLAAVETDRIGIPFIEDAAVPTKNLAGFVKELGDLIESYGLNYGMFGHADVGCVHVRPMMNMRKLEDRKLIREISDKVALLCKKNGGLIWGEHGKGMRGEFVEYYVGQKLFELMREVKQSFDPNNLLNPGKLVTAAKTEMEVIKLDQAAFRGETDEKIDQERYASLDKAISCNGNGACHNWSPNDPMCPSFKITKDKDQAPKGRATLLREWAKLKSTYAPQTEIFEFEKEVANSLSTCLSCKSCTGSCPIQIDIPSMKSFFLEQYYKNHRRPMRDHLIRTMESLTLALRKRPKLANFLTQNPISRSVLKNAFKLVDSPLISNQTIEEIAKQTGAKMLDHNSAPNNKNTVCILTDSFTGIFETSIQKQTAELLCLLGFEVWFTAPMKNGKALEVRGYRDLFELQKQKTAKTIKGIQSLKLDLISLEPAVTDLYRRDYSKDEETKLDNLFTLDQFLHQNLTKLSNVEDVETEYKLFLHCTEKTADPAIATRWIDIFSSAGLKLSIEKTGCCGMAGLFGHEAEHQKISKQLFDLSWKAPLNKIQKTPENVALATGFSCRSQTKRFADEPVSHPISALLNHMKGTKHDQ